jgi:hypothetical protein
MGGLFGKALIHAQRHVDWKAQYHQPCFRVACSINHKNILTFTKKYNLTCLNKIVYCTKPPPCSHTFGKIPPTKDNATLPIPAWHTYSARSALTRSHSPAAKLPLQRSFFSRYQQQCQLFSSLCTHSHSLRFQ